MFSVHTEIINTLSIASISASGLQNQRIRLIAKDIKFHAVKNDWDNNRIFVTNKLSVQKAHERENKSILWKRQY